MKTKHSKEFLKRNAKFKAATKEERRVMVAKDVLQQLKQEAMIASSGVWVALDTFNAEKTVTDDSQLCEIVGANGVQCNVCALGSLMVSTIRFRNKVTYADYDSCVLDYDFFVNNSKNDKTGILSLFSEKQRRLIEIAFERGGGFYDSYEEDEVKAENFGYKYDDENSRLIAIMKNIVKNNGTFIP